MAVAPAPLSIHDLHDDLLATIFIKAMGVDCNAALTCEKDEYCLHEDEHLKEFNFGEIFTLQQVCRRWRQVVQNSQVLWADIIVGPCSEFCAFHPNATTWRRIFQWLAPHAAAFVNLRLVGKEEHFVEEDEQADNSAYGSDENGFPDAELDQIKLVGLSMMGYNVRVLDLENFFNPDSGAQLLDVLVRMKFLQELHVSYVSQDFIDQINRLRSLTVLTTVDLEADGLRPVVLHLSWMPTHLECLSLSDLQIQTPPQGLLSQWSKLVALDLCGVDWSDTFFEVVCEIQGLRVLCIEDCEIQGPARPGGPSVFQKLENLERLELIKEDESLVFLNRIRTYLEGISCLKKLVSFRLIVSVGDARDAWLQDARAGLLSGLSSLSMLTELCLEGLGLGHVPQAVCGYSALRHLSLANNLLREFPAQPLPSWHSTLRSLGLSKNAFAAVPEVVPLLTSLKSVNLRDNPFNSGGE